MMKLNYFAALGCALVMALTVTALAGELSPDAILKHADEVRNPGMSYELTVKVENHDNTESRFDVKVKDGSKTFIRTLAPARDKGRNLLMLGDDMWAYVPNLKRAVRVALQQKISGQASNGDISRMRWAGDYKAAIEKSDGKEWVLMMTALRKGLTYDKIRLWVDKDGFKPSKAEYLSLSGNPLKAVTFGVYKKMEGALRPSVLEIKDATDSSLKSKIIIEKMKLVELNASQFTEGALAE